MISPPFLKIGDTVCILSPAKAVELNVLNEAKLVWEKQGFNVVVSDNASKQLGYFAGTDQERLNDFQDALNDPNVKAIICARGGYGCIRMLEKLNWTQFYVSPKWIIGFSDVTVFHLFLQSKGYKSIHATMPLNYAKNSKDALDSLFQTITGNEVTSTKTYRDIFPTKSTIVGGNLSILYSLIGTPYLPNFKNTILFIEDISEQLYHFDRIFHALKMSGILNQLAGLIIGEMTDMKDTDFATGFSIESIVEEHTKGLNIPISYDFPAGHVDDNRAIVLG